MKREPIDRKFRIRASSTQTSKPHTEFDSLLFLAKDKALPATLDFYRAECAKLGADENQLAGVDRMIERVRAFQVEHADIVKVADVDPAKRAIFAPNQPDTMKLLGGDAPAAAESAEQPAGGAPEAEGLPASTPLGGDGEGN